MAATSFGKRLRAAWRSTVSVATRSVRFERAARLRARGKEFAKSKRADFVNAALDGGVQTVPTGDRRHRVMPSVSRWHESRADGIEHVFERVEECGGAFEAVARCTSNACRAARSSDSEAGVIRVPLGCSSRFFCDVCKTRIAVRFRREFQAARLGIIWGAQLQGRHTRWRPRFGPEARLSERLVTLTAPHVGTAVERVRWMFKAWPFFLRAWNVYIRGQLGAAECTDGAKRGDGNLTAIPFDRDGQPIGTGQWLGPNRGREERCLVRALCHEVRVFEWTKGGDGQGHPHFHIWAFGPFMPQELLKEWWREAWERASGRSVELDQDGEPILMVDVRKIVGDSVDARDADGKPIFDDDGRPEKAQVANELIKYLTKDWGAEPEVFAEIYAELFERRARQTSRGFSAFSVPEVRICEDCGCLHESELGFRWTIEGAPGSLFEPLRQSPSRGPPAWPPLPGHVMRQPWREDEIRDAHWKRQWAAMSPEREAIRRAIHGRLDNEYSSARLVGCTKERWW
jgi:hypothetical protein